MVNLNFSESDGEVVSVEHSIHKRSVSELSISIKKDGYDRKYILQSSEGFFAGRKTKVWLAKKSGKDFEYVLKQNVSDICVLLFNSKFLKIILSIKNSINKTIHRLWRDWTLHIISIEKRGL